MFVKNRMSIDQWMERISASEDAVLLDVRTRAEYREGHIPGSINLPLNDLESIDEIVDRMDAPVYVYCHSGARSTGAEQELAQMGYTNVRNIGGIADYTGTLES